MQLAIEPRLVHLRSGEEREWSSFPAAAQGSHLEVRFAWPASNPGEYALKLRQQDVKQPWRVLLNGQPLGELIRDEADLTHYLPVAAGRIVAGENVLRIESAASATSPSDDIRVGQLRIEPRGVRDALSEATLEIDVVDAETSQPLPARITIADADGSRHATAAVSGDQLAARPGVVYTSNGRARFSVPAGQYTIYAGRGFEYSLAQIETTLAAGQTAKHRLAIRREVPTPGYIACDTHIHTVTFSGHGDATIDERMITLAGEGIELPIATDHNVHIDYESHAQRLGVRQYFTPVMGNEVTTPVGHFNIFPVQPGARVPDHRSKEWSVTFDQIFATPGVKVAILNHARDLHSGVRPFGPERFNSATGENLAGWPMRFNGMEVINSGATQTDPLRLVHDWMALLNRGYQVTPVGSSDSHDVARYIVGQGRTYIRCDDADVARLDVAAAVESFLQGRVLVSYGLLAELTVGGKVVGGKHGSGELAALAGDEVEVAVRVLGPHWTQATHVHLYANGQLLREEAILPAAIGELPTGVQWQQSWKIPLPKHDVHLVAIALGKGIDGPHWTTAKPYQPTSPAWQPYTLGLSGAVWLDGDGDGRRSSARDYAERALTAAGGDLPKLVAALAKYDQATAAQAAHLFQSGGGRLAGEPFDRALKTAPPHVSAGIRDFQKAWRDSELVRDEN
ncbi:MAG: CehA/McbA family metallohydrolase [Pirellulaceae bacterium]